MKPFRNSPISTHCIWSPSQGHSTLTKTINPRDRHWFTLSNVHVLFVAFSDLCRCLKRWSEQTQSNPLVGRLNSYLFRSAINLFFYIYYRVILCLNCWMKIFSLSKTRDPRKPLNRQFRFYGLRRFSERGDNLQNPPIYGNKQVLPVLLWSSYRSYRRYQRIGNTRR